MKRVKEIPKHYLFFDGASKGNPGPSAGGWHVNDDNQMVIAQGNKYFGPKLTNNQAEYMALAAGLTHVLKNGRMMKIERLIVQGDSKLVINQVNSTWKCKKTHLQALRLEVMQLYADIRKEIGIDMMFVHVRREFNKKADELANNAIVKH
jgi:ribonuclease HI